MKKNILYRYDSMGAFLDTVETMPAGWRKDYTGTVNWNGTATWSDALGLAHNGWPEVTAKAAELAMRLADRLIVGTASALEQDLIADVTGAVYDPSAYYSGVPECWVRPTPTETRRGVSICCNLSVSSGISVEYMIARGTAIAALVLALQQRGHPVTLDVVMGSTSVSSRADTDKSNKAIHHALAVRVVDGASGSQLDIDRLLYAVAQPSMVRWLYKTHCNAKLTDGREDKWSSSYPASNYFPEDQTYDLRTGGAFLDEVQRWKDGGEAWIIAEYERQTQG